MSTYIRAIAAIILSVLTLAPAAASAPRGKSNPKVKIHTAFHDMPRKVMDTPDYTYFFVHQHTYATKQFQGYFSTPSGGILFVDKNNTSTDIHDLAQAAPLSGADMRMASADPASGLLVIAYNDGGVDLVTPGRKVTYIDRLKLSNTPGTAIINGISFDPATHDVWISTRTGFLKIEYSSLAPDLMADWGDTVTDICPVGDKVVAVINDRICEAPIAEAVYRGSFKEIPGVTSGKPTILMPLSPNHFAYLAANGQISMVTHANNKWTRSNAGNAGNAVQNAQYVVVNPVEQAVSLTSEGYYIATPTTAHLLSRPTDAASAPSVRTVALPSGATLYNSSYDLSTFWFFYDKGSFCSRTLSGSEWSEPQVFAHNGPQTSKNTYFRYSPKYGLVMTNRSHGPLSNNLDDVSPALVSAFKNGKWSNKSPIYFTPYRAQENNDALVSFNTYKLNYPVSDPLGFSIDPLFPDVAFVGSTRNGIAGFYLDDPHKNPFLFRCSNDTRFNGFDREFPFGASTWDTHSAVVILGYDVRGNLWAYRTTALSNIHPYTDLTLYVWTPEARRNALENDNTASPLGLKEYLLQTETYAGYWVNGLALQNPANSTKLILTSQGGDSFGANIRIVDTKGTVDNTADDEITCIRKFRANTGALYDYISTYSLSENPVTGDVVVSGFNNVFIFNPGDPVVNGVIDARMITLRASDGTPAEFIASLSVASSAFDEYGRLWIGTNGNGIIGVEPDGTTVFAHYTDENSDIPSNSVGGIGWNPDTKTLFASCDNTVAELTVDLPATAPSAFDTETPYLYPAHVTADFGGTVAVRNAEGLALRVIDSKGRTIRTLDPAVNGTAFWDLLDDDSRTVPSGLYYIEDATGTFAFPRLALPVTR